jgi:uncharacterized membrane protein YoaK (UPF0700 family)
MPQVGGVSTASTTYDMGTLVRFGRDVADAIAAVDAWEALLPFVWLCCALVCGAAMAALVARQGATAAIAAAAAATLALTLAGTTAWQISIAPAVT